MIVPVQQRPSRRPEPDESRLAALIDGAPEAFPSLVAPLRRGPAVGSPMGHFAAVDAAPVPGAALRGVAGAASEWRADFRATGTPSSVVTCDLVTLPYPTRFGLWRAASVQAGQLAITNRMLVVRWPDAELGRLRTLLFEPSDVELGINTPFFAALAAKTPRRVTDAVTEQHGSVAGHLERLGIAPEDVDYLVFDHLHTQDVRRLVGTTAPQPDLSPDAPVAPAYPNASLLVQRAELEAMTDLSPLQRPWYQPRTFADVRPDAVVAVDGDTLLGPGVALLSTPGHTYGNQTLVLNTASGVWASSENAVAAECLVPEHSRIRGLAASTRAAGLSVVMNANTLELASQQYVSMAKEKAVVDASAVDERFPQFFPSSELTRTWWSPTTRPTFTHGAISHLA